SEVRRFPVSDSAYAVILRRGGDRFDSVLHAPPVAASRTASISAGYALNAVSASDSESRSRFVCANRSSPGAKPTVGIPWTPRLWPPSVANVQGRTAGVRLVLRAMLAAAARTTGWSVGIEKPGVNMVRS